MNEETIASESERLGRRVFIVFCIASFLFVTLIVLIGTLLVM